VQLQSLSGWLRLIWTFAGKRYFCVGVVGYEGEPGDRGSEGETNWTGYCEWFVWPNFGEVPGYLSTTYRGMLATEVLRNTLRRRMPWLSMKSWHPIGQAKTMPLPFTLPYLGNSVS